MEVVTTSPSDKHPPLPSCVKLVETLTFSFTANMHLYKKQNGYTAQGPSACPCKASCPSCCCDGRRGVNLIHPVHPASPPRVKVGIRKHALDRFGVRDVRERILFLGRETRVPPVRGAAAIGSSSVTKFSITFIAARSLPLVLGPNDVIMRDDHDEALLHVHHRVQAQRKQSACARPVRRQLKLHVRLLIRLLTRRDVRELSDRRTPRRTSRRSCPRHPARRHRRRRVASSRRRRRRRLQPLPQSSIITVRRGTPRRCLARHLFRVVLDERQRAIAVGVVAGCNATLNEFEWYRRTRARWRRTTTWRRETRAKRPGSMRARCARGRGRRHRGAVWRGAIARIGEMRLRGYSNG